ncbi:TPA: Y4yA family PLP-dependent enzyme [Providencia stuartii]|uniref:Y4yA family PLP-dependent enzyme n=1 Tax=Providencia stuartii TaxID=588 RepID=UPI00090CC41B|nr:Y4yA family PLP-dependent enzyme [Providencia stuartii]APG51882.1 diaminopimelate decarboxylase [Providencia stuartii]AVL41876.1 Y4yA family PLP-dependent enzyme [Providencia stuartii]MBG5905844.1 Y4yA family PLP-dependent enzyme [Providencia stuartii]MBG5913599.1 Y4yA family PLP-dependent enzyme [Providencia stuartii]MBG5917175.1 Y4yA family PLP-dependent enzyme [Providencia stuartii]
MVNQTNLTHFLSVPYQSIKTVAPTELPPLMDEQVKRLCFENNERLVELVKQYGSPLNVIFPHTMQQNILKLNAVFQEHGITGRIMYGVKVNQSNILVKIAVEEGIGVDVSSLHEWQDAYDYGISPEKICATGPAKTNEFLWKLILHNSLIVVDSLEELQDILNLLSGTSFIARVLFRYQPQMSRSRFGMKSAAFITALQLAKQHAGLLWQGIHFHLGGYKSASRVQAFRELQPLIKSALSLGFEIKTIDIGGGLPVQYVSTGQYQSWIDNQTSQYYQNNRIPTDFYPYGGEQSATQWLTTFLSSQYTENETISQYLKKNHITLTIEPGRCLVDQSAISLFRVVRVNQQFQHPIIFVEGSSFSACETWFNSEFLLDPLHVLVPHSKQHKQRPTRVWIAGHSCLENDVITHRLILFTHLPQAGDLLIFINTAGYQMDLLENQFHRHPIPCRLYALENHDGQFIFFKDNK